jgi:predicted ester cyclase
MANLKEFITEYFNYLGGKDLTDEMLDKYITDPELKEHIRVYSTIFPRYDLIVDDMVEEGNKIAVRGTVRGVHKGDLMGIPPTGKEVSYSLMIIYVVENRKIVNHWMVADQLGLMQQLGVVK